MKNNNTVSKTLIYGAHEAIPCAHEFSVFEQLAHMRHGCVLLVFLKLVILERIFIETAVGLNCHLDKRRYDFFWICQQAVRIAHSALMQHQ